MKLQYKRKSINCSSHYNGVSWDKRHLLWQVQGRNVGGKTVKIGNFYFENEAAQAFNDFMTEEHGEDADLILNYIDPDHVNAKIPIMCNHKECRKVWKFCTHDPKTEGFLKALAEETGKTYIRN